jgi:hypothetical protein
MNTVRGLALQVVWFDEHMLEFKLSAGNESFSGETHFYAALDEARSLADRIGGFPESPADLREYQLGGSGLPGYGGARIRLACKDRSGHLVVRVDVSTEHGPDLGTDSASVHFDAMPAAVDAFVDELRRMRVEVGQMARHVACGLTGRSTRTRSGIAPPSVSGSIRLAAQCRCAPGNSDVMCHAGNRAHHLCRLSPVLSAGR